MVSKILINIHITICTVLLFCGCTYIESTWSKVTQPALAEKIEMASLFQDGMVLQRNTDVPVWGWCEPGRKVTVSILTQKVTSIADDTGCWNVLLKPIKSCGPIKMTIAGKEKLIIKNIMVGEVWICSGQSNMQWSLGQNKADEDIKKAKNSRIRLFKVRLKSKDTPQYTCEGKWQELTPESARRFSAVGYYFGKKLYKDLNGVAIGLIQSAWGGTRIQAWTAMEVLKNNPAAQEYLEKYDLAKVNSAKLEKEYQDQIELFKEADLKKRPKRHSDPGNFGYDKGWAAPEHKMSGWEKVDVPTTIENHTPIDGAVWFRRSIKLPDSWANRQLVLELGVIDDFDTTYFNNEKVGSIGKETPDFWLKPRKYQIPKELVKAGKNTIAVRIFDHYATGGFMSRKGKLKIYPDGEPSAAIPVSGEWYAKIEHKLYPFMLQGGRVNKPFGPGHRHAPAGLRNAMINPLIPYAIKGVIWYQGESNASEPDIYRKLLPEIINDWRRAWGYDYTFLIVQLANYKAQWPVPQDSLWAETREAQMLASSLPKVGVAITIDLGEEDNIHPKNKLDVGKRLALLAEYIAYGAKFIHNKKLIPTGPIYESMKVDNGKITIKFKKIGHGLVSKDSLPLRHFAIAGKDRKFHWAKAEIVGKDEVIVWSPIVKNPAHVRYAWADNPYGCNLYNKDGLPAAPFRTDTP